jgi:hypothetical protein
MCHMRRTMSISVKSICHVPYGTYIHGTLYIYGTYRGSVHWGCYYATALEMITLPRTKHSQSHSLIVQLLPLLQLMTSGDGPDSPPGSTHQCVGARAAKARK